MGREPDTWHDGVMSLLEDASARLPAMLQDVRRIIECESPSDDLDAITRSAALVADVLGTTLTEAGLPGTPETIVIDGVSHLRWRLGGPTRVLLLGHHDTVWPHGSLATHPYRVENGILTGPGCFDMAVGLVQAAHACALLAQLKTADALAGVTILVTGDEEIGSNTSRALLEDEARDADAVLVLEAAGPGGALKTERKGTSMYTVMTRGRAAHAGLDPDSGINAGLELAYQLQAVAALHHSGETTGTTVVPTSGAIGTTSNTVPAQASFNVDIRARTAAELDRIDTAMHSLFPRLPGTGIDVDGGVNRLPLERDMAADLFARAIRLAPAAGIDNLTECSVGGASDGNFTAALGTSTLDGLGGVGGGAHADDEHVEIEHVPHRTALLTLLIADILDHDDR